MAKRIPKEVRDWYKKIGSIGGKNRSKAKVAAARRNGKLNKTKVKK